MAPPVYTDMSLRWQSGQSVYDTVEMAVELGFERIAIDHFTSNLQGAKGKKQTGKSIIPAPCEILLNDESMKSLQSKGQNFEQLSRFTAVLQDASNTHKLGSPEIQAYDLVCVQTTSEKTFQLACSTLEIDIICLNLSESLGFSLKRALVNLAVKRGIHFEILYSPALRDNSVKRNIISNAVSLINAGGGKNIILSSGSEQFTLSKDGDSPKGSSARNKPLDMRSPYDVINLGKLLGLSNSQAKNAISKNCRAVLKHAESRKTCKSVISAIKSSDLAVRQQWILSRSSALEKRSVNEEGGTDGEDSDSCNRSEEDNVHGQFQASQPKKIKLQ